MIRYCDGIHTTVAQYYHSFRQYVLAGLVVYKTIEIMTRKHTIVIAMQWWGDFTELRD